MLKIENTEVCGWEAAIRGMRNPMNSWEKSDSWFDFYEYYADAADRDAGLPTAGAKNILGGDSEEWCPLGEFPYEVAVDLGDKGCIGPNDAKLMMNLAKAGSVDAKYRRMIVVTVDITAPLYWWKEFDTYKVGTVANSCSTMHKIQAKEFTLEDFSCEHLMPFDKYHNDIFKRALENTIYALNEARELYLDTKDKNYWWQMIQLLPSSYNQRRTVMLNYEVLAGIYPKRKNHKLDEWHTFCDWIKTLPYSEIITMEE